MKATELQGIGERKAVGLIVDLLGKGQGPFGIGDDCAIIEMGKNLLLVTTDMITQRTHSPTSTPWQMGWQLIAINLSDIGAKGGRPLGMVNALGLPKATKVAFVEDLIKGMDACVKEFKTLIVGGDTKQSRDLVLTGTAFGMVPKKEFMSRYGAKVDDLVAVTGKLGLAAAGLHAINNDLPGTRAKKALLEPWPRLREGMDLAKARSVHSSMDISDGLSTSLHHLADASKVGFLIDLEKVPLAKDVTKMGLDPEAAALHFGGDYELLITFHGSNLDRIEKVLRSHGTELSVIGKVTKKGVSIKRHGRISHLENGGWEHFKAPRRTGGPGRT